MTGHLMVAAVSMGVCGSDLSCELSSSASYFFFVVELAPMPLAMLWSVGIVVRSDSSPVVCAQ